MIVARTYVRKPVHVDAVQVSKENFRELARWADGIIQSDGTMDFIRIRVHTPKNTRQTQAFVGDWILRSDKGFKVYSNKAFTETFELVEEVKT